MTLLLSVPEFLNQHPEIAERQQALRLPWTLPLKDASGKNQGYRQGINLRPGLDILIDDYTLQEELRVETGSGKNSHSFLQIEMSFMLSADNCVEGVPAHHNFLDAGWYENFAGGVFTWPPGERILKFDIHFEPAVFSALLCDQLDALPTAFTEIIQSSQPIRPERCFWQLGMTTPAMHSAIYQMLHCPYQGATRWIYWESKVLELLALRLEEVKQLNSSTAAKLSLNSDDIDRIYYAREILHQRITDPPSLMALARLVGLNDYKLKAGFKQIFGTTVFENLRRHRLCQARRLLQEKQISVAAAAAAVGYTSKGHFAAAFRKQFGINPSKICR